jgi:3,4-dihydroxy 2-butanone 4-phosphate synthase/GTP cyclohydrolase II
MVCVAMNDDGTMARLPDLKVRVERYGLKIYIIKDLINYRMRNRRLVPDKGQRPLCPRNSVDILGSFCARTIWPRIPTWHNGKINPDEAILVGVDSERLTDDVFSSNRCACGITGSGGDKPTPSNSLPEAA